ncbi:MAG: hypothetical protein KAG98_00305 [Lentisphaeria bacterium]|nr:hypothetical protein [Lentisphaeria bacterium]
MKLLNIAWHTVKNCTRQPFYLIAFLFTAISATTLPILSQFSLYDQQRMLIDSLFGLVLTIGIILTILINEYSIGNDFCNGRALLLFSKPIGVLNYTLGKLLGNTISILIFLLFSGLIIINLQNVVIQNFFFNFFKFTSFIISIGLGFLTGALANYFFRKNFSASTLLSIFGFLLINTLLWTNSTVESDLTPSFFRQGQIYAMLSLFVIFIGATAAPVAVKLKSGGILLYTTLIIALGLLVPNFFPSINDYWLIDYYYSSLSVSYNLILKGFLNISIYSLFFTMITYLWLKLTQLAKN